MHRNKIELLTAFAEIINRGCFNKVRGVGKKILKLIGDPILY